MEPLQPGSAAPEIPEIPGDGPRAVVFYKVTCPTCQVAAPAINRLHRLAGDRFVAVGQDPPDALEGFSRHLSVDFPALPDEAPYPVSNAYGVRTVPTVFVLQDGEVAEVVESWDREGWNRAASRFAELAGATAAPVSEEGDGLPPFKPG